MVFLGEKTENKSRRRLMMEVAVSHPGDKLSSFRAGYPVQADLICICYYCILYVGSLANKNQSINHAASLGCRFVT